MNYFPLFVRLQDTPCLVVGGGEVGLRKVRLLLKGGAKVLVRAPKLAPDLADLVTAGRVAHDARPFAPEAVAGMRLVIAATNDADVNHAVSLACLDAGVLCNAVDNRADSTAIMPALIDRAPLVIAVSTGGASPVLATRIRQQLEQLFPPAYGTLARFAGEWRARVQQHFSTVGERRRFWQRFFDGPVARDLLAGRTQHADGELQKLLAESNTETASGGFAWIVGAGPGDPELLTLKAARVLATADTILHDRLVAPAILELARRDAEFISVGKQAGRPSIRQDDINALLVDKVRQGRTVCRLKGGDPFIFGRGGEEIEALQAAGLPWQVIPGITAASGCAAAAGVPLTHREVARAVTFITAHTADGDATYWSAFAHPEQTLVIYMGVGQLAQTADALVAAGRPAATPALVIENGTTDRQRMVRGALADIAHVVERAGIGSPAVVMVGAVAALATLLADERIIGEHDWSPAARVG